MSYDRKRLQHHLRKVNVSTLKAEWNSNYHTVRWVKHQCLAEFLEGSNEIMRHNEHFWAALAYTSLLLSSTTLALEDTEGNQATTREDKEAMVQRAVFPHPTKEPVSLPTYRSGRHYQGVNKSAVYWVLFNQSQKNAPSPNRLNFSALLLISEWDARRVTTLIRQCGRSGHYPRAWKNVKGVILRKLNKLDYITVKFYWVISLLKYFRKV